MPDIYNSTEQKKKILEKLQEKSMYTEEEIEAIQDFKLSLEEEGQDARRIQRYLQTFNQLDKLIDFDITDPEIKQVRQLLHTYIETKGIDYEKKRNLLKWLEMDYNRNSDKIYYKYPKRRNSRGAVKKIKTVKMSKPSETLIEAYESKRSKFQDKKNKEFYDEIKEKVSDSDNSSSKSKKQKIMEELEDQEDPSTKQLAKKYDTEQSYVSQVKNQI
ncbi:MAG: hypothetical protein ABEJ36_03225 [Candidatus Nanosalina sp.]